MNIDVRDSFGDRLVFSVDFKTGQVTGPDAARVLDVVSVWDGRGYLAGTQSVPAGDPLHNPRHLAVMLVAWLFDLTPDLIQFLPSVDPVPEGAVG